MDRTRYTRQTPADKRSRALDSRTGISNPWNNGDDGNGSVYHAGGDGHDDDGECDAGDDHRGNEGGERQEARGQEQQMP